MKKYHPNFDATEHAYPDERLGEKNQEATADVGEQEKSKKKHKKHKKKKNKRKHSNVEQTNQLGVEDEAEPMCIWQCPCGEVEIELKLSGRKLTGSKHKVKNMAFWTCSATVNKCTPGVQTEVAVLAVKLSHIEVQGGVTGGWVWFEMEQGNQDARRYWLPEGALHRDMASARQSLLELEQKCLGTKKIRDHFRFQHVHDSRQPDSNGGEVEPQYEVDRRQRMAGNADKLRELGLLETKQDLNEDGNGMRKKVQKRPRHDYGPATRKSARGCAGGEAFQVPGSNAGAAVGASASSVSSSGGSSSSSTSSSGGSSSSGDEFEAAASSSSSSGDRSSSDSSSASGSDSSSSGDDGDEGEGSGTEDESEEDDEDD